MACWDLPSCHCPSFGMQFLDSACALSTPLLECFRLVVSEEASFLSLLIHSSLQWLCRRSRKAPCCACRCSPVHFAGSLRPLEALCGCGSSPVLTMSGYTFPSAYGQQCSATCALALRRCCLLLACWYGTVGRGLPSCLRSAFTCSRSREHSALSSCRCLPEESFS